MRRVRTGEFAPPTVYLEGATGPRLELALPTAEEEAEVDVEAPNADVPVAFWNMVLAVDNRCL